MCTCLQIVMHKGNQLFRIEFHQVSHLVRFVNLLTYKKKNIFLIYVSLNYDIPVVSDRNVLTEIELSAPESKLVMTNSRKQNIITNILTM